MLDVSILDKFSKELHSSLENFNARDAFSFDITTTEKCNFQCDYCFEKEKSYHDRQYQLEDMKNAIYHIIEHPLFLKEFKSFTINFWGGEPTLRVDDILYYIDEFANHPLVYFFFYTNGTLQENLDCIVERFKQYDCLNKVRIQISWDGDPIHDIHRISGTKSYNSEYIKSQIKRYMNMGVQVDVKSTITPKDFSKWADAWKSFKALRDEVPQRIIYAPTLDQTYYGNEYYDDFKTAIATISSYEYDYVLTHGENLMSWFGHNMISCSYKRNTCCADVYGNVYPCHGFLYENDEVKNKELIGTIKDMSWLDSFLKNRHAFTPMEIDMCQDCIATYCVSCCVKNYIRSDKELPHEKWFDRIKCGRCDYYKLFGAYDLALHRLLSMRYGDKENEV